MRCAPVLRMVALVTALASAGHGVAHAQAPVVTPTTPVIAGSAQGPAQVPPTPIEQAVIEHACRVPGQAMQTVDSYDACLADQLAGLRVEFGRDLKKLSAAERRTIDRACTALRAERGRDAYIACLDDRLTALVIARGRTRPAVTLMAPPPLPHADPVVPPLAGVTSAPAGEAAGASSIWLWTGLIVTLIAMAGAFGVWKTRQKPRLVLCRVCGELANAGDLCAACRHELADSQRRAAAERAEQADQAEQAGQAGQAGQAHPMAERAAQAQTMAQAAALPVQAAQPVQDEPQARQGQAHVPPETPALEPRTEPARRGRDADRGADHRRWQEAAAATISDADTVTPNDVLAVAADATADQIRAAYDAALAKYAADQVAHLGIELQDHYRRKREAAEHAFQVLSGAASANAPTAA